ncbi:MAG: bis-aminopropyl spermidine synthase family protein [Vulcanimicrobiota bacterium]
MPVLPRDLWLQSRADKVVVENCFTSQEIILEPAELERRLPELTSPPVQLGVEMLRALERVLKEWGAEVPSGPVERLELCCRHCLERLARQDEVARDLKAVFRTARAFLSEPEDRTFEFLPGLLPSAWQRPSLEYGFGQLPCMPESTQRRVSLAREHLSSESRGLVLGDDDLMGLGWGLAYEQPCDIFELDQRILEFYGKLNLSVGLTFHQRDLTLGLPEEFHGKYDFIFTDPMYGKEGMNMFLLCCSQGLSHSGRSRLFLSTRPDLIEEGERLPERLAAVDLRIVQTHRNFSRYKLPEQTRRLALESLRPSGLPRYLLRALLKVPYYYSDLLEVSRIL